jgi:hypothetical protein
MVYQLLYITICENTVTYNAIKTSDIRYILIPILYQSKDRFTGECSPPEGIQRTLNSPPEGI